MSCNLIDIPCHLQNVLFGWIAFVPWWGWALAGLVLVGIVWKIAGWPGIIALAAGAGFFLGRRSADDPVEVDDEPPVHRRSSQKPPPGKVTRTVLNTGPIGEILKRLGKK